MVMMEGKARRVGGQQWCEEKGGVERRGVGEVAVAGGKPVGSSVLAGIFLQQSSSHSIKKSLLTKSQQLKNQLTKLATRFLSDTIPI